MAAEMYLCTPPRLSARVSLPCKRARKFLSILKPILEPARSRSGGSLSRRRVWLPQDHSSLLTLVIRPRLRHIAAVAVAVREPALGSRAPFSVPGREREMGLHVLLAEEGCQAGPSAKGGCSRRSGRGRIRFEVPGARRRGRAERNR